MLLLNLLARLLESQEKEYAANKDPEEHHQANYDDAHDETSPSHSPASAVSTYSNCAEDYGKYCCWPN